MFGRSDWLESYERHLHGHHQPQEVERSVGNVDPVGVCVCVCVCMCVCVCVCVCERERVFEGYVLWLC